MEGHLEDSGSIKKPISYIEVVEAFLAIGKDSKRPSWKGKRKSKEFTVKKFRKIKVYNKHWRKYSIESIKSNKLISLSSKIIYKNGYNTIAIAKLVACDKVSRL